MGGEEAVTWEEAVNMGGGCGMCPPPLRNYSADQGGRHSSKIDGGLKSKHGSKGSMGGA